MVPDDDNATVLYEVDLEAESAIEAAFDTWLRDHVADMLQLEGFLAAEVLEDASAPPGRVRRIVQYRLRSQADLDRYLREQAPAMRERGVALFGDRFSARRRQLIHREDFVRGAVSTENCLNCGEVLKGQHCSHCGQRARVRVLSLTGLLRDLFGDLVDFDSRIWRTLLPLAFRPGMLTREFLRGRRTYYTPPFRMYLTLSVMFFLATSFGSSPGDGITLNFDGQGGGNLQFDAGGTGAGDAPADADASAPARPAAARPAAPGPSPAGSPGAKLDPERQRLVEAIVSRLPERGRADARADLERDFARLTPEQLVPVRRIVDDPCSAQNLKVELGPLGDQYGPRLRDACRKIMSDSKTFGRALYENIPKMMFIFLPLIAAVMFVLYLGSGRYYVEHLLFFVHYHAFFFLVGLLVYGLDSAAGWLEGTAAGRVLDVAEAIVTTVLVCYVPYYLYRAMRRVYEQGRIVTLVKFSLLGVGYVFFMALTAVGLLAYTALTL